MFDSNTFSPFKIANRTRLLKDFLLKNSLTSGLPVEIGIEITNLCNLGCIMCPYSEMVKKKARPQGKMSFKLFKKIIDEVAHFAEIAYLHGMGEALLHPQLFEFIDYAKSKGVRVGLSTNATLLDKDKSKKLLSTKIDYLIFGLDGATKKTYEKIRKGGGFEKTTQNVKDFLKLKKQGDFKTFVVVQLIEMKENSSEVDKFIKLWQQSGADVIRVKPKIALKEADKKDKSGLRPYCFHIFRQININWDGVVVPCCEDVFGLYPLGNANKISLKKIWNNQKSQLLKKANFTKQQSQVRLCQGCNYPQPSLLQSIGALSLDHLTVKKILPRLEKWQLRSLK